MKTILAVLISLVVFMPTQSKAGFLLEPTAGYSMGTLSTATSSGTINGLTYGGRVGYVLQNGLVFGAEYDLGNEKLKVANATTEQDWTDTTIYGIVGYYKPMGFRIYGGYGFTQESKWAVSASQTLTLKGTAYKFGAGWQFVKYFALNVEYAIYTLKDYTVGGVTFPVSTLSSKFDYSAFRIMASFPFNFGEK